MSHNLLKIVLDSRDAQSINTEGTRCKWNWSKQIEEIRKYEIEYMSLYDAEIPNSFYNVQSGRNDVLTFDIFLADMVTPVESVSSTIPGGNYSAAQLIAEMKTQMDADFTDTFTITFSNVNGKITIVNNTTNTMSFDFDNSTIGNVLGFRSSTVTPANSLTGDIVDLRGITSVYLYSNLTDTFLKTTNSPGGVSSFLGEVKMTEGFGSTVFYRQQIPEKHNVSKDLKDVIEFELRSRNDELLDIHKHHWKITLLVSYVI